MDFSKKSSSQIQRKMADSIQGKNRRNQVLNYLAIENGHSILDLGCGGGHLVHEIALSVGPSGKAFGIDPSKDQIKSAYNRCSNLDNAQLICSSFADISMDNGTLNGICAIQSLEYIEDLEQTLSKINRLLKTNSKFINVSVLWDHWRFHGPEKQLNNLMHEAFRTHCFHQMLPLSLPEKLKKIGFVNIQTQPLAFLITRRNENCFATFAESVLCNFAKKNGVSEENVEIWKTQLRKSEEKGTFGFTSIPVLNACYKP